MMGSWRRPHCPATAANRDLFTDLGYLDLEILTFRWKLSFPTAERAL